MPPNHLKNPAIIVMASGFSRRFGERNKLVMPLQGQWIIDHTMNQLLTLTPDYPIKLVTNHQEIIKRYEGIDGVERLENPHAKEGIAASIRIGVQASPKDRGYLFVPADQIYVNPETIRKLTDLHHMRKAAYISPSYNHRIGSPKLFPACAREELLQLKGDLGGRQILRTHEKEQIILPVENPQENIDIDTYETYLQISEELA